MAELVESEDGHSPSSPTASIQLSPISQAIDALNLDPTLSYNQVPKMFRVCRQTLTNRYTGKSTSRKAAVIERQRITPKKEDEIEDLSLQLYEWGSSAYAPRSEGFGERHPYRQRRFRAFRG